MRLRQLDLTRYGKFTGHRIDFGAAVAGSPDLHIVYGLNEAGKSTSLSAYLDLIYGIEQQSRYNFLHAYDAMQLSGILEADGQSHEMVRVKARGGGLRDASGQPLNEATLAAIMGGVGREAYRAMFSLDDETLEKGGEAILESKGDLGELLFSASAGLAGVSAALDLVSADADKTYKKRARSTVLAELKQRLVKLKEAREAIDVQASAHRGLTEALAQAKTAYEAALAEQAEARRRRDVLARYSRARPLADHYRRLVIDLAPLADLPRPPADWSRELPALGREETRLETRASTLAEDIARQTAARDELASDDAVIALGPRIRGLARIVDRFTTAEGDLPKRQQELAQARAEIDAVLASLDRSGHGDAETLLLPAALQGRLRDLIEARSGIASALASADREAKAAQTLVVEAEQALAAQETGEALLTALEARRLSVALSEIRNGQAQLRSEMAARTLAGAEARLRQVLGALAPFIADATALRSAILPSPSQIAAWRQRLGDLMLALRTEDDRIAEIRERLSLARARHNAITVAAGAIDDTAAAALRAARDAAWRDHRERLDAASAEDFAGLMREDDLLAASRLSQSRDLAELRGTAREIAADEALLESAVSARQAAGEAVEALAREIAAQWPVGLLQPESGCEAILAAGGTWLSRRDTAFQALEAVETARGDHADAQSEAARDRGRLCELLASLAPVDADEPLDALLARADLILARHGEREAAHATALRSLEERRRGAIQRRAALEEAAEAERRWQQDWQAARAGSWFAEIAETGAVRSILDALTALPAALQARDVALHRIAGMERDQQHFSAEVAALVGALEGEATAEAALRDPLSAAGTLAQRLAEAERVEERRRELTATIERLTAEARDIAQARAEHDARKRQMADVLQVETLEEIAAVIAESERRDRLEARRGELAGEIVETLQAIDIETALSLLAQADFEALSGEEAQLDARLELMEGDTRERYARLKRAEEALGAIGGDDAVARIEAERRTVLLEIEEAALRYLRLRSGAMIATQALASYRDRHRSAMMKRASEAFAQMTCGEYQGLAARPDRDGEKLIGLTRAGGSKLASEMSKGTRFQLYLALRLAGYEEFARARPAVPFIADDIMETFDEPRSEQVLDLFGAMARIGQVIYLTHHRHLVDLARKVVPAVRVHELP